MRGELAGTRFADVRWLAETGSTNTDVLELARQGEPEGVVVVADRQTAGRGRRGRTWEAPPGGALMATVLLRPPAARAGLTTMALAVAAADAVAATCGVVVRVKWPNDLVWPGDGTAPDRKVAGILAEADWPASSQPAGGWSPPGPRDRAVVAAGIGINLAWGDAVPAHLAELAVARGARLYERSAAIEITGHGVLTTDGSVLCDAVIVAVDGRLERLLPELAGRVRTARLQMLATAPTGELQTRYAVYSRYGYEYWQQLDDGSVLLGGMRDRGGEGEWTDVAEPAEPVQSLLETHLRQRLGVQAPITHRWAGAVGYTPDGLPVFEEVRPRVWAIGGYCGTGNVVGAICGRAVARMVVQGSAADAELFRA